jgi:hypothetical protein
MNFLITILRSSFVNSENYNSTTVIISMMMILSFSSVMQNIQPLYLSSSSSIFLNGFYLPTASTAYLKSLD